MRLGEPTFSVIIPTFNRAHCITQAIDSVLRQTFTDFELIIVDDGSTDNTQAVIQHINDTRIRYIYQANRGVAAARNLGASVAKGNYITFLDSDDEALPYWLGHFVQAAQDSRVRIVCSGIKLVYQAPQSNEDLRLPRQQALFGNQPVLFLAGSFAVCRKLFNSIDGYVEGLVHSENWELGLRLVHRCQLEGGSVTGINKPLVLYYKRSLNNSEAHKKYTNRFESAEYILQHHRDKLQENPREQARYNAIAGVNAARLGRFTEARRFLLVAVYSYPLYWRSYAQLLVAFVPPLARRLWLGSSQSYRLEK